MPLPNYKDGSIINLMSSIGKSLGYNSPYNQLKLLAEKDLDNKTIILFVIDGLSYEFFKQHGRNTVLNKYLKGKITSVFPSVTSAAIPLFFTGTTSLTHEMTGWNIYLRECNEVVKSLPYISRNNRKPITKPEIHKIFNLSPFTDKINVESHIIIYKKIINSSFTKAVKGKAQVYSYTTINQCFTELKKVLNKNKKRKYIFVYYPLHDSLCHEHFSKSKKVIDHFKRLAKGFNNFDKLTKKTNATMIITSDHGMIDIPLSKRINVDNHPIIINSLKLPFCGDFRFAYCHIKFSKFKEFEDYVKAKLGYCCSLYNSKDLIKKGYFGLEKPSKRFLERIGDYTIIMKKDYAIYHFLKNEKKNYNKGDHGGLSDEEINPPLIIIK